MTTYTMLKGKELKVMMQWIDNYIINETKCSIQNMNTIDKN